MPNIHRMVRNAWAHLTIFYLNFLDLPKRIRLATYAGIAVVVLVSCYLFYGVKVDAHIEQLSKECREGYPLVITVHNHTFGNVSRIRILLDATEGDSDKGLLFDKRRQLNVDLAPMQSEWYCLSDIMLERYELDQYISPKVTIKAYDVDYAQ